MHSPVLNLSITGDFPATLDLVYFRAGGGHVAAARALQAQVAQLQAGSNSSERADELADEVAQQGQKLAAVEQQVAALEVANGPSP